MTGPTAQLVALTCHANAFLRSRPVSEFFPGNSTCQFCDSVQFFKLSKGLLGNTQKTLVAVNPNVWFEHLRNQGSLGVRLSCTRRNEPGISDRMSSAFVGGGGTWVVEAVLDGGTSDIWLPRWEVLNRNAPDRRIWRVSYGRVAEARTHLLQEPNLESLANRFRSALAEILAFSRRHKFDGFSACFARAIETLDSEGEKRHGFHRDLTVDGTMPLFAVGLLDACQSAWVFGGMGSWNDTGFEGSEQAEYESVSEQLFISINEVIQSATNASL